MENFIYVRKSEISNLQLEKIVGEILKEKESLERQLAEKFSEKFILAEYQGKNFYYNVASSLLYPVFEDYRFEKVKVCDVDFQTVRKYFPKEFQNMDEVSIITDKNFIRTIYDETAKFMERGVISTAGGKIDSFIIKNGNCLTAVTSDKKQTDEGYVIPVIDFGIRLKTIEEQIEFLDENGIELIFPREKMRDNLKKLRTIYAKLKSYGVEQSSLERLNRDEVIRDIDSGEYIYPLSDYREKLLRVDEERIYVDRYDEKILLDSKRGHWDIFCDCEDEDIENRDVVRVKTDEIFYGRDPRKDLKYGGTVSIDFGTKSTVVAIQEKNDRKMFVRVGVNSYANAVEESQYENPTAVEFLDIENFLAKYNEVLGRPFTRWKDMKVSHSAVADFRGGSSCVKDGLKQWCGNKDEKLIMKDGSGKLIVLPPYNELKDGDIDPIEYYAYYIGSYINNMHTKNIFLDYLLSFPITYEKEISEKIVRSFARGIAKSFPLSIVKNPEIMKNFRVTNATNEPTAYFLCAVKEYGVLPKEDEKIGYGVFDFGGGTTDFDFGVMTLSPSRRYDYILKHFGKGGDKYLGGENILNILAYEMFKKNIPVLKKKNITFSCPKGAELFDGYEGIVHSSYESAFNIKQLSEALRGFWEEREESKHRYASGRVQVTLLDRAGNINEFQEIKIDTELMSEIIKKMIRQGVENFFSSLIIAIANNGKHTEGIRKVKVFLAGNSSRHSYVKEAFIEKIEELEREYREFMQDKVEEKMFEFYPALGTPEAFEIQSANGISISKDGPTGKTGVAYGLLDARDGGRLKIISVDDIKNNEKINFKYYVGYVSHGVLKVVLNNNTGYNRWVEFMDAGEEKTEIYYSDISSALNGEISASDKSIKRQVISLDEPDYKSNIYIRAKDSETIEYVVATEEEIKNEAGLKGIKEIKL